MEPEWNRVCALERQTLTIVFSLMNSVHYTLLDLDKMIVRLLQDKQNIITIPPWHWCTFYAYLMINQPIHLNVTMCGSLSSVIWTSDRSRAHLDLSVVFRFKFSSDYLLEFATSTVSHEKPFIMLTAHCFFWQTFALIFFGVSLANRRLLILYSS